MQSFFLNTSGTDDDLDHILVDHVDHVGHVDHTDHTDHIDHVDHIDHIDNISVDIICCAGCVCGTASSPETRPS